MNIQLTPLTQIDKMWFIQSLQQAFKQAFLDKLDANEEIISQAEIESAMNIDNAESLLICLNGKKVGGAVVVIDPKTHRNTLELFFVQTREVGKNIGVNAWKAIENRYPQTEIWVTYTPYFEKRNIHFYVNKCGFHIVEFFHEKYPDPDFPISKTHPELNETFRFEKRMK